MTDRSRLPALALALAFVVSCAKGRMHAGDGSAADGGKTDRPAGDTPGAMDLPGIDQEPDTLPPADAGDDVAADVPTDEPADIAADQPADEPADMDPDMPPDLPPDLPPPPMACTMPAECPGGLCVDGWCCDTACAGKCEACNLAGTEGVCSPYADGIDPNDECAGTGTCGGVCNGASGCKFAAPTVTCGATTCTSGMVSGMLCDGAGACAMSAPVACAPFVCGASACKTTCTGPADCTGDAYCDGGGVCRAKKSTGTACGGTGECVSGFCADGVCCGSACTGSCEACHLAGSVGTCSPVTNADDDTCKTTSTCDGAGVCKKRNGETCPGGVGECASGFCADGVCCNEGCTGTCRSCALTATKGTCSAVTNAEDADTCTGSNTCSAAGACAKKNGTGCGGAGECASGFCKDGACCNTACTTPCNSCATGTCTPVISGDDDPECQGTGTCDEAGACRQNTGQPCSAPGECDSGFCADGVCCDAACTGTCRSCNLPGTVGTCTLAEAGTDPKNQCGGTCTAATCMSSGANCDGTGSCSGAAACGVYGCSGATGCKTACATNADCCGASPRVCLVPANIALACGSTDLGRNTSTMADNVNMSNLCTMVSASDRGANTIWSGYEYVYRFTASSTGMVTFKTHWISGYDVDLFVFNAEAACPSGNCCSTITSCLASAHTSITTDETVTISATAGASYFVVVDAVATTGTGKFDLSVTCP